MSCSAAACKLTCKCYLVPLRCWCVSRPLQHVNYFVSCSSAGVQHQEPVCQLLSNQLREKEHYFSFLTHFNNKGNINNALKKKNIILDCKKGRWLITDIPCGRHVNDVCWCKMKSPLLKYDHGSFDTHTVKYNIHSSICCSMHIKSGSGEMTNPLHNYSSVAAFLATLSWEKWSGSNGHCSA